MRFLAWMALGLLACSNDTFVSSDASVADGGGADGSVLDGSGADACTVATTPCQTGALCASFDDHTIWPFTDVSSSGSAMPSSAQFVTCPFSLAATITNDAASSSGAIGGKLPVSGSASDTWEAVVDTDILLPNDLPVGTSVLDLHVDGDTQSVVSVDFIGTSYSVVARASGQTQSFRPLVGQWGHMRLDVIFSASGGSGHVSLDYTDAPQHTSNVSFTAGTLGNAGGLPTMLDATIGLKRLTGGSTPTPTYYDDVTFRLP